MTPKQFVERLAATNLPSVFNPWRDRCALHDRADAPARRRENLINFLDASLSSGVETMWIARDLGYRGGRRTGVPLTDEIHLHKAADLLGGIKLERATAGPAMAERTAAIVWSVLAQIGSPVVLWNVFPFHPHVESDPLSNRCHTKCERFATWPLLEALVSMVKPKRIVAIGRDAESALADLGLGIETAAVRHPSYGGQADFIAGLHALYGVRYEENVPAELPFGEGAAGSPKARMSA